MAKNGHNAKAIAHAKYSLGVKKLKLPKICEKRFYKHSKVVLCKKTAPKNSLYSKNEIILKMAKNGHKTKAIAHAKYSLWVKK